MEEKRDILKDFTEKMEVLFGRSLNKIILYGSYARGDYKENSDIEIEMNTVPDAGTVLTSRISSGDIPVIFSDFNFYVRG